MPNGTSGYASAVVDNKIYLFEQNLNQIYDPATDSWSQGTSPPSYMMGVAVATTGAFAPRRIYVLTSPVYIGSGPQSPCAVEVYNPANDEWTTAANITTTRAYFGATIVNDKVYAIGGAIYNLMGFGAPTAANEEYTPIGYGTPDLDSQSPSPLLLCAIAAAATIIIITATALALKKKRKLKTAP